MALPPRYDLQFYSADHESLVLNWKTRFNTLIDFTGAVVVMSITRDFEDTPILVKEADTIPAEGRIEFQFTPEELETLLSDPLYVREDPMV